MKVVYFGVGNIGWGFVGLLLYEGGYDVVFFDVVDVFVDVINVVDEYIVYEVGFGGIDYVVIGFCVVNSCMDLVIVVEEVVSVDVVIMVVGLIVLWFVVLMIVVGFVLCFFEVVFLQVMVCENVIGVMDLLCWEIVVVVGDDVEILFICVVFVNIVVDWIVLVQLVGGGVDVIVELYFEWVIEVGLFGGVFLSIFGVYFVDDFVLYIECKFFMVNMGYVVIVYFGVCVGIECIVDVLVDFVIVVSVVVVFEEIFVVLVVEYGLDLVEFVVYCVMIFDWFCNFVFIDMVQCVGCQLLCKILWYEWFVGFVVMVVECGLFVEVLVVVVLVVFEFDDLVDEQLVELQWLLCIEDVVVFIVQVMEFDFEYLLFFVICDVVVVCQDQFMVD